MKKKIFWFILVFCLLLLAGCNHKVAPTISSEVNQIPTAVPTDEQTAGQAGKLVVHFIDVGQADAILVQTPAGETMLIDAGGNDDEKTICSYLQRHDIKKIQVLVGTHPHEDHIGAMDAVINAFPVENVYLPKIIHNTKTFADLLQAIKSRSMKIKTAQTGVSLPLSGLSCVILSPKAREYEEINDYSAVIRITYGRQSFLFCGDAGEQVESEMLASGEDLSASIIKIGHHGSSSSSSYSFLRAVAPLYAVISCGQDNPYGHPHQETLAKLKRAGIEPWRTDQLGTIIITTDGSDKLDIYANAGEDGGEIN